MPASSIISKRIPLVALLGACVTVAVSGGSTAEVVDRALPDDVAIEVVGGFDQIILILYLLEDPDVMPQKSSRKSVRWLKRSHRLDRSGSAP